MRIFIVGPHPDVSGLATSAQPPRGTTIRSQSGSFLFFESVRSTATADLNAANVRIELASRSFQFATARFKLATVGFQVATARFQVANASSKLANGGFQVATASSKVATARFQLANGEFQVTNGGFKFARSVSFPLISLARVRLTSWVNDDLERCLKSILLRPRSGLNENSPALQRWGSR